MNGPTTLIRGVRPIALDGDTHTARDIRVDARGQIAEIGPFLDPDDGERVLESAGAYVSPSWIDLHVHCCPHLRPGVEPDRIGPSTGVEILVDAGSAGCKTFESFYDSTIRSSSASIRAFLNIGTEGLLPHSEQSIDLVAASACARAYPSVIRGIKVQASRKFIGETWLRPLHAAKRLGQDLGLPVMVHVAEPPVYVEDVVDVLDRGDVITHCFHGKVGNSLRTSRERVVPLYRAAADKGIVLDIGHGAASFSVESARTAFAAGIAPHTISTDLHRGNVDTCVRSLALTMSKMLALGMNLEDVVSAVSKTPAGVLVEPDYGELVIGARARFTIFTLESGSYQFLDTPAPDDSTPGTEPGIRKEYSGDALIQPLYTVWGTSVKPCRTINLEDV